MGRGRVQELVEARGGSSIRGEVLSWMTFVQFVANVSAPMILGAFTAIQPKDARFMFLAASSTSVFAGFMLRRIVQLKLMPQSTVTGTRNRNSSKRSDNGSSPDDFQHLQWGSEQEQMQEKS